MKSLIPTEVRTLFADSAFLHRLCSCFDQLDIKNKKYLSTLNDEDLIRLFRAYIAFNYALVETDDEKLAYLHALKREVILLSATEGFIKLFIKASLTDGELAESAAKEALDLLKLKKYKNHEYNSLLSKYDKRIKEIASNEENIRKNQHRISIDELISLTKCLIVEEMIKNDDAYDIITDIDSNEVLLDEYVLNAFSIYLHGIKGVDERKVDRAFNLVRLQEIITIAKSDGYLR